MLLIELLQASSTAQGTPITVYVTLFAAVLAALASLNATRISSKTAKEVATLAAQTARDSARIAAETAREIKEKDYKNDYYKLVIAKRMKALEAVENIIGLFGSSHIVGGPGGNQRCHSYFVRNLDDMKDNRFDLYSTEISSSYTWRSRATSAALKSFLETVIAAIVDVNSSTKDSGMKLVLYTKKYSQINQEIAKVEKSIGVEMENLYDVENFLKSRFHTQQS